MILFDRNGAPIEITQAVKAAAVDAYQKFADDAERARFDAGDPTLDCRDALEAAVADALAEAEPKPLYLRAGVWHVLAATVGPRIPASSDGFSIRFRAAGQALLVFGDGPRTVVKRVDTPDGTLTSSVIWVRNKAANAVAFCCLTVDGNEANYPHDPANIWKYEQVSNIRLLPESSDVPPGDVILDRVEFRGCVGDGMSVSAPLNRFHARGVRASGRTRRPRLDIKFGPIPHIASVTDFVGDSLGAEWSEAPLGQRMTLQDVEVRSRFYLSCGGTGMQATATNVRHTGAGSGPAVSSEFAGVNGQFTTCAFFACAGARNCQIRFRECAFTLVADSQGRARSISVSRDQIHRDFAYAVFAACRFKAPNLTQGAYLSCLGVGNVSGLECGVIDCVVDNPLTFFCRQPRHCWLTVRGGTLQADRALLLLSGDSDVAVRDMRGWTGVVFEFGRLNDVPGDPGAEGASLLSSSASIRPPRFRRNPASGCGRFSA